MISRPHGTNRQPSSNRSLLAQSLVANFVPVAVTAACFLILAGLVLLLQTEALDKEVSLRAESLARLIAGRAELAAVIGDHDELHKIAAAALAIDDVLYVVVATSGGSSVVAARKGFRSGTIPPLPAHGNGATRTVHFDGSGGPFVEATAIIQPSTERRAFDWDVSGHTDATPGVVRIGLSTAAQRVMFRTTGIAGMLLSAVGLAAILAAQRRQMRKVLEPLRSLIGFTRRVAEGDFKQRAVRARDDEVGQLAEACNDMAAELDKSRQGLLTALEKANDANRLKTEFLANMSHEIRTPLNGVLGLLDLSLESAANQQQREYLATAASSAQTLLSLLNDVLDFSTIEADKLELQSVPFPLVGEIEKAANAFASQAQQKGLDLLLRIAPDVPDAVVGDPDRLRQVLSNLISNAIKFTRTGHVVVEAYSRSVAGTDVNVHFAVRDTGIGIDADKRQSIFEAFRQADNSMTRQFGGSGLGLTICSRLVHLWGGSVAVDSEPGHGSTFRFNIPLRMQEAPSLSASPSLEGYRILIVDDQAANGGFLAETLRSWRAEVQTITSPLNAIPHMQAVTSAQRPYNVVILDCDMAELDGYSLAGRILADPDLCHSIVLMTNQPDLKNSIAECGRMGVAHLVKPVLRWNLLAAIAQASNQALPPARVEDVRISNGDGLMILLAEDNPVNRMVACRLLERDGHRTQTAGDGLEAIALLQQGRFDLVLMDIQMPRLDGISATHAIRAWENQTGGHIPIVAMTAHALIGDRKRCLEAGMDGYVSKPVSRTELNRAIQEAMGSRSSIESLVELG